MGSSVECGIVYPPNLGVGWWQVTGVQCLSRYSLGLVMEYPFGYSLGGSERGRAKPLARGPRFSGEVGSMPLALEGLSVDLLLAIYMQRGGS